MDGNYSLADIAAATGNGRNNDGMFGGDGSWWIIVLFIFAFFGWGNNGWGNNGNGGGYTATAATQADIQRGFDNSAVISKLDEINSGLCDGFYAMNNGMLTGFNGINTNIMQTGFGIQHAINADTVANMQNANALQAQLANCCCETREAIQGVNYNMAQNTCALQNTMNNNTRDIIDSQNAGTRAILDYLCNEKFLTCRLKTMISDALLLRTARAHFSQLQWLHRHSSSLTQLIRHRFRHIRFLIRTHITDADATLDVIADNFILRVSFD
mgnify:CR=1 FL=1